MAVFISLYSKIVRGYICVLTESLHSCCVFRRQGIGCRRRSCLRPPTFSTAVQKRDALAAPYREAVKVQQQAAGDPHPLRQHRETQHGTCSAQLLPSGHTGSRKTEATAMNQVRKNSAAGLSIAPFTLDHSPLTSGFCPQCEGV